MINNQKQKRELNLIIGFGQIGSSIYDRFKYLKNKEINQNFKFTIDINDYQEKKERNLIRLAKNIAREVSQTKVEAKLDSMNSYERRIIHNALANSSKVYTESCGEEPERYVVIKPKGE